ncbi:MAG: peptide chain release factor N(5)-glutamine methyltransferase [Gammaproteobacteria bacterium]|nr:MAG: peptide chain release factor N(5)-glutamine methyltransferase [Gammaproteobacteria bacterium]
MSEQIDSAIAWGSARCSEASDTPKLDAELLLAHCIHKPRSYLYSWPEQLVPAKAWQRYQILVGKRIEPTPIAYLLGQREFFSLNFKTTSIALVPRPETELLVETCLELCPSRAGVELLELGTGTGVIAISLKVNRPDINLIATDISTGCLDLARINASDHGVAIEWIESDWFSAIDNSSLFDMILSNPPYIAATDPCLMRGDLRAEPLSALSPGENGLEALQQLIVSAPAYLKTPGYLILEHGFDQQTDVARMMREQQFTEITCQTDLNGLPRLSIGRFTE